MSFHYSVPPAHYTKFYDSSSPYNSSGEYVQYVPAYDATPTKRHSRKPSYQETPKAGGWYSPVGASPPYFEPLVQNVSPRKAAYVSYDERPAAYSTPTANIKRSKHMRKPSQPIRVVTDDGAGWAEPHLQHIYPDKPKPKARHTKKPSTDSYFYFRQEQIHEEQQQPKRSRARASTGSKPTPQKTNRSSHVPQQATEKDAARAGIPSGYSIKNWDPTEKPIVLLGSVFDANALGKWIYDWTVYHHGASTPMADMAGDLWLLLIKLAGKMKRAEDSVRRIRNHDNREMIEGFISSGSRLWDKFKTLLKDCEYYMMKAAKREGSKTMGKSAGTEFVDSIFGRDRYLESTERIMNNVRLWNMRFDVNCEDILRRPSAA